MESALRLWQEICELTLLKPARLITRLYIRVLVIYAGVFKIPRVISLVFCSSFIFLFRARCKM